MHETMVAQSLVTLISEEAGKQRAKPIGAKISCGTLNTVNDEVLRFAFEVVAEGTPCEGIELHIEHKPLKAVCRSCGCDFVVEFSRPRCTECGCEVFELLPDAPLLLEEIDFQSD